MSETVDKLLNLRGENEFKEFILKNQGKQCEHEYIGVCFVKPESTDHSIFGYSEAVGTLAVLLILYTITDIRYRFRVAISPISLKFTFYLMTFFVILTILINVWFKEAWLIPEFISNYTIIQGVLALLFLALPITLIYYAYINPTIFCKKNYKEFHEALYKIILKGSDADLPIIANELLVSASSLVNFSMENRGRHDNEKYTPDIKDYAHDIILLIGHRKFCRHVIASSPATAIVFFQTMANLKKYNIPIGQFAKNISREAILNEDSALYHEDEGYNSGLIGYIKPFSRAIYGNYRLVETLASSNGSPLDIDYKLVSSWNALQLEVYCRVTTLTFENYLENQSWEEHSFALYRAFENIKESCRDVYKLNDMPDNYNTDVLDRLRMVVDFACQTAELLNKQVVMPPTKRRIRGDSYRKNMYDLIAEMMFSIINSVASVNKFSDLCWAIHHNMVWSRFFWPIGEGRAWEIIRFKLRRLLYDEIKKLDKFPNYSSSKILGFCLNVMGLKLPKNKSKSNFNYYALKKVVIEWVKQNYMHLKEVQSDVANSCLIGSITFEEKNSSLVKTYFKGLKLEAPKEYLELDVDP